MSKRSIFLLVMALYLHTLMPAQTLSVQVWDSIAVSRLDSVLKEADETPYFTGVCVYDLTADTLLFARNQHKLMRPASAQKLVTAISAIDQLGADYPFETRARISGELITDSAGGRTLFGRISVRGSMDPLVRQRDLQCIIDTLRSLSVGRIEGLIVADRSMKCDTTSLGPGWCWDDENPVLDPMLHLSVAKLISSIRQSGIEYVERADVPYDTVISDFLCASHSVNQILQKMMKDSDNQHAESMLCLLGTKAGGANTKKDRESQILKTVAKTDQPSSSIDFADGSGLSLYNYITPRMLAALLKYAYQNKSVYDVLLPSLPLAGVDGTLASRFRGSSGYQNIRAKTGTVSHVVSLAGYLTATTGHAIAFVIISNGSHRASSPRHLQDCLCEILTQ